MPVRFESTHWLPSALVGILVACGVALAGLTVSAPTWVVVAAAFAWGVGMYFLVLRIRRRVVNRWLQEARRQSGDVIRELVRVTVPRAAAQATNENGCVAVGQFRDLVVASIAKATGQIAGSSSQDLGPAVWEANSGEPRTTDQERRLEALLTYPDVAEAVGLLDALKDLGPQTIQQFVEYAVYTRERLSVGLEPIREGAASAVLTGHLVSVGLVQKVDGPVPGALQENVGGAYYALTHRGYDVARLFSPRETRPQELGALDASPPATRSH